MKPEKKSKVLLSITRSKGKMYEFFIPEQDHIVVKGQPDELLPLTIGILGDLAAQLNGDKPNLEHISKIRENLLFSARFFDALTNSRLFEEVSGYTLLLAAASYYLCDLPGTSLVLAEQAQGRANENQLDNLGQLLQWLLIGRFQDQIEFTNREYFPIAQEISRNVSRFYKWGFQRHLFHATKYLRDEAYSKGSPRELLLADVIGAIVKKKIEDSVWTQLPKATGLNAAVWRHIIKKQTFVKELWPSQKTLGEREIFKGKSALIQMPTSAGKTKSIELVIRSAFMANRTKLAVIVAPFRALCHEIKGNLVEAFGSEQVVISELSDVYQPDFAEDFELPPNKKSIIVVTPEKLLYAMRHSIEIASNIGVLVLDEGHLFDSDNRGVNFELLVTSLKRHLSKDTQILLISAVITNGESINTWLNRGKGVVIDGSDLLPTQRVFGFSSWKKVIGQIQFVEHPNIEAEEFYVPRVLESSQLSKKGRERKPRFFPERKNSGSIGLYLGLKLVGNGSVALFCGSKPTASRLLEEIVDAYSRNLAMDPPSKVSAQDELQKMHRLYSENLGINATPTLASKLGILIHHASVPHGIRLAVEHAMRLGHAKFVICTSTLAQGVNLPIRYLLFTSIYQAGKRIKVRDFHNLVGRAGRAGMYTEGTILFTDPEVYDMRLNRGKNRQWNEIKKLVDPKNSEPCASAILGLLDPIVYDDNRLYFSIDPLDIARLHIAGSEEFSALFEETVAQYEKQGLDRSAFEEQFRIKKSIIGAIESYLMNSEQDIVNDKREEHFLNLAEGTLAFHLASDENKENLKNLFLLLSKNISDRLPSAEKKQVFGKTLLGLHDVIKIELWIQNNLINITECSNETELLAALWPLIEGHLAESNLACLDLVSARIELAIAWIKGASYFNILESLNKSKVKLKSGNQRRTITIDHVVEMCEGDLAFDGMVVLGAAGEIFCDLEPENYYTKKLFLSLQKMMKYGISDQSNIFAFEAGFSDRIVAQIIGKYLEKAKSKEDVPSQIKKQEDEVRRELRQYPAYFTNVLNGVIIA